MQLEKLEQFVLNNIETENTFFYSKNLPSQIKDLYLYTLNHKTAPISIREKVSIHDLKLEEACKFFKSLKSIKSCLILSTCNRTEIYFKSTEFQVAIKDLISFFKNFLGVEEKVIKEYGELLYGMEVINHSFNVASGLDSLIIGERQILSQLRFAYSTAQNEKTLDSTLEKLFQIAIQKAKDVHSKTNISKGSQSVSSAAVDIADKFFGPIGTKNVMILGAGKMAKLAFEKIVDLGGAKQTYALNRSPHKVIEFSEDYKIDKTFPFEKIYKIINEIDILICAAGAPHYILFADEFKKERLNWNRKLTIIDISLPRNIDFEFEKTPNVALIDIDSLQSLYNKVYPVSKSDMNNVEDIIELGKEEFLATLNRFDSSVLIKKLKEKVEEIRSTKLNQFKDGKNTFSENELEYITKNILNTIFHKPIQNIKESDIPQSVKEKVLKELFDL